MIDMEEIVTLFKRLPFTDRQEVLAYLSALVQEEKEDKSGASSDSRESTEKQD